MPCFVDGDRSTCNLPLKNKGMLSIAGKPVIEVPGAGEDFFAQQEDGFFDNLPEQPLADQAATAAGGLTSAAGGSMAMSNGGAASEPATPMADANNTPEGAERVS